VIRAEVDDFLNKLEDPKKMVRQMVMDMEDALDDAVAAVGRAIANEKMLEKQLVLKKENAQVCQQKAEAAITQGDEEQARKALMQKVVMEEAIDAVEKALVEARDVSQTLKKRLAELKIKLASAQARQGALSVRKEVAQLRSEMGDHVGIMDSEAFARYDQYCRDVAREEITAQVYAEISGQIDPVLDESFERLEQKKRVEAEIQALKAKQVQS
jgi:phage shock protein A